ncbi:MAG TPA: phenylalanine--tRNA ligase subunit beta [Patescibacteria group bacterium]|jgi:phenylalanyl-tRNA synthetase beta chain|nr:phenylalanine--tRNA ligase subunit beta [Patescibacteria group bacterium]
MNIKILDSWLRDYVKTKATPQKIGELLSLSSVSVERLEKYEADFIYDIEITTNRPDLMGVVGLARETATVLKQNGIDASFVAPKLTKPQTPKTNLIEITNDPKLVNRLCAVVMDVKIGESSKEIKERLEASGTRSLNNLIDITNYVMKTIGHPTHVFDFDRLNTKTLIIREAKKGEVIKTLDEKDYSLNGGEIVAVNDQNEIVDLLGIMGLQNSVVTAKTKRILYFINNNQPAKIRKASMTLGIRTEAAVINEKNLDAELAYDALLYGIEMFAKIAGGKIVSDIIDLYPNKVTKHYVEVSLEKINQVIGVSIDPEKALQSLSNLGFKAQIVGGKIKAEVPSFRIGDVEIEEDIIEEIARIYGYHNLPSVLPPQTAIAAHKFADQFYFEQRVKSAMKYWGFTEVYSYSMVSQELFEGPLEEAVEISNPLSEDMIYMRKTLVPSLLKVVSENKNKEVIKIFEIANVYNKRTKDLPQELMTFAGVIKKNKVTFFETKGLLEQLCYDLGIKNLSFKQSEKSGNGASVYIEKEYLGEIEILDANLIDFELNFELLLRHATLKKEYKPLNKFPPIIEDLSIAVNSDIKTEDIIANIYSQSNLVIDVSLKDTYKDSRTFHINYQDPEKNLTNEEVSEIRKKITSSLKEKFKASVR